jgi:hypothetical protein
VSPQMLRLCSFATRSAIEGELRERETDEDDRVVLPMGMPGYFAQALKVVTVGSHEKELYVRRVIVQSVLIVLGLSLGFVAARVVDALALDPLVALIACAAGAVIFAVMRRRQELPEFLAESAVFTYTAVLGLIVVRATPENHFFAGSMHRVAGWIDGSNPLVLLAGVGLCAAMIALICVPAWALAQRLERRKTDERDQRFLDFISARARGEEDP